MKKLSLLFLTIAFFAVLSSSISSTIRLDDCSFGFKTKRFFNPIHKMGAREKNKELREYAQDSVSSHFLHGTAKFFTPLKDYSSEILYLIKHRANPNLAIPYKHTGGRSTFKPIYLFIENNDIENTRRLLEHGAHANEPIIGEFHPLLFAYTKEMVKLLLEYGAKIENTYDEVDSWSKGKIKRDMFKTICLSKYDAELVPFYLAQLEEEKRKDQAQIMLNILVKPDGLTDSKYHQTNTFKRKKAYLIEAGAQLALVPEQSNTLEGDWSLSDSKKR